MTSRFRSRRVVRGCLARSGVAAVLLSIAVSTASAQWLDQPAKGVPRTVDGRPDFSAPAPRAADGKPDLSGIWEPAPDPAGTAGGVENIVAPRYMIDITRDVPPSEVPFQPWAAELYKRRNDDFRRDNPLIRCLPVGVPRLAAYGFPYKVVQTPDLIVFLYEAQTTFRQVFMDGRPLPKDPQPTWMGYSSGRWEGDTLVVETTGFNDKSWLDGAGHPHSDAMHVTERFTRRSVGQMDIEVIIDDPKAYTRVLRYVQPQVLRAAGDLIEYVCENAKEVFRAR